MYNPSLSKMPASTHNNINACIQSPIVAHKREPKSKSIKHSRWYHNGISERSDMPSPFVSVRCSWLMWYRSKKKLERLLSIFPSHDAVAFPCIP